MRMTRWAAPGLLLAAGLAGCGASGSRGVSPTTATPAAATPATSVPAPPTSTTTGAGGDPGALQQQRQAACDATGTVEDCGAYNLTPGPGSPYFGSQPDAFGNYSVKQGPGASGGDDTPGGSDTG